ncbi:GDCCVxC domain-containing (seleno)protein [Sphingomonas ginsengisoli An et al. 2013]|nr:GDCCVxC domain-containing (seleno)protein [Sphingomonas ginsengisoli An et al. 2013]
MPTDACQYFYDCKHCGVLLKPLAGDCCVFCSFANVPCPPIQDARESGEESCCSRP